MTDQQVRDTRNPGHFWADNEIVDDYLPRIGAYGFAVYMLICRHARGAYSKVAISSMAKTLAVSEPTIRKAINALVKAKLLEANDADHTAKTYTILDVKSQKRAKPDLPQGVNDIDPRAKPDLGLGVNQVDPIKTNTKTSKKEQDSPQPANAVAIAPPDSVKIFEPALEKSEDPPKVPAKGSHKARKTHYVKRADGVYVGPAPAFAAAQRSVADNGGVITEHQAIPTGAIIEPWPVKERARDPVFDAVALGSFNLTKVGKKGGHIGTVVAGVKDCQPDGWTPEKLAADLTAMYAWYKRTYKLHVPTIAEKICKYLEEYRGSRERIVDDNNPADDAAAYKRWGYDRVPTLRRNGP
jgi:hypothetical protein